MPTALTQKNNPPFGEGRAEELKNEKVFCVVKVVC